VRNFVYADEPLNSAFKSSLCRTDDVPWEPASRQRLVGHCGGVFWKSKESGLVVISPAKAQQHFDDVLVDGLQLIAHSNGQAFWLAAGTLASTAL
jgi:hypothetical protein